MKRTHLSKLKQQCVDIATENKLAVNPKCEFCGEKATTCHHVIRQSRSNYLRTCPANLIPICARCHMRLHSGYEALMTATLIEKYGLLWIQQLRADSVKTIKDNVSYWQAKLAELKI